MEGSQFCHAAEKSVNKCVCELASELLHPFVDLWHVAFYYLDEPDNDKDANDEIRCSICIVFYSFHFMMAPLFI